MTKNTLLALLVMASAVLIFTGSCKHDQAVAPLSDCDTLNVTFSGTVNPIIQETCLACHNNTNPSAGISLEGYDNVVIVANSGVLIGAIRWDEGYSQMPQGGEKLSDCKIEQIQKWIDDGTPNN